jgi:predicted membrane protein
MIQAVSIVGALLILVAYAAHQGGALGRDSITYHVLNILGGAVLLVVAVHHLQIGFIILESVWTGISVAALVRTGLSRGPGA